MKEINIYFSKENNAMKKLIFKILPAVILFAGAFIVLSGCEKEKQMKVIYFAVNFPEFQAPVPLICGVREFFM